MYEGVFDAMTIRHAKVMMMYSSQSVTVFLGLLNKFKVDGDINSIVQEEST